MAVNAQLNVNRLNGISPLTIVMNALGTTADGVTHPYQFLDYMWDMGWPNAGNYQYGNPFVNNKNSSIDPIAAICYEIPEGEGDKTFTITLHVTDGVLVDQKQVTITVYDPLGPNGYTVNHYISQDGDFGNAPAANGTTILHHTEASTALQTLVSTYINADGRRLLLRGGQTYTATGEVDLFRLTWAIQGYDGVPIIHTTTGQTFDLDNARDGRFIDMEWDGEGNTTRRFARLGSLVGGVVRLTFLRIHGHHSRGILQTDGAATDHGHREIGLFDCNFHDGVGVGQTLFLEGTDAAVVGNLFDTQQAEHLIRFPLFRRSLCKNNTLTDYPGDKEGIALRAPDDSTTSPSEFFCVVDNNITCVIPGNPQIQLGAANTTQASIIRDGIIRRNFCDHAGGGSTWLDMIAERVAVQSNIHTNLNASSNSATSIALRTAGPGGGSDAMEPNRDHWFDNNTSYHPQLNGGGNTSTFCTIAADALGTLTFRNNLIYSNHANFTAWNLIINPSSATIVQSGNSTNSPAGGQFEQDPLFADATPTTPAEFQITTGSYAIGSGTANTPCFRDYYGNFRRLSTMDKGAHAFTLGTYPMTGVPSPVIARKGQRIWAYQ